MNMNKKNKVIYFILFIIILLLCFLIYNRNEVSEYFTNNDINYLTIYKTQYNKKRVGHPNDGGYVIIDLININYDILLSGGVAKDSSFEDAFLTLYPELICYAFDGTVEKSPSLNINYNFVKKNIAPLETNTTTNLNTYLDNYKTIFLKMDIEGHEIPWLESLNVNQLNNIAQIVIEFHSPFTQKEEDVFKKLNEVFFLVHFHGNNYSKLVEYKGIHIPDVFECTYINKKYIEFPLALNDEILPTKFDAPNDGTQKDFIINYPPFVNSN